MTMATARRKTERNQEFEKEDPIQDFESGNDAGSIDCDSRLLLHVKVVKPEQMEGTHALFSQIIMHCISTLLLRHSIHTDCAVEELQHVLYQGKSRSA